MLRLQNIQVKLIKPIFKITDRWFLKISTGSIVKNTNGIATINNQQIISWHQSLSVPQIENQTYVFEVYEKYQYGEAQGQGQGQEYQEIDETQQELMVLTGRIFFHNPKETDGKWDVFVNGDQKIGILQANIVTKVPKIIKNIMKENSNSSIQTKAHNNDNKILRILSMVARMTNYPLKRAWITIEIGEKKIKTGEIQSKAGELIYTQVQQIGIQEENTFASIKIYTDKNQLESSQVGEAILLLNGPRPNKKIIIMRKGVDVGEIYIESRIIDKTLMNNKSNLTKRDSRLRYYQDLSLQTIQNPESKSSLKQYQTINQHSVEPDRKIAQPYRSIDFSRLQNYGISSSRMTKPTYADLSMMSIDGLRRRNSIVNHNTNIIFPRERRFIVYEDRKNQKVSYLKERNFQFKLPRTGKYYRGASFGYGDKVDFSRFKRQNPGVGNYKLPSIWDRY